MTAGGFYVILREPLKDGAMSSVLWDSFDEARYAAEFWSKNGLDYHLYQLVKVDGSEP